ncbi:MAG: hypothetical protein GY771_11135 [bacterium]|nr:hypothetical protein [bacterium]
MNLHITKWHVLGVVGAVLLGLGGFAGLEFSSSDTFCGVCHYHKSFTEPWHASAHFEEGVTCSNCHIGHNVGDIARAKWTGMKDAVYFIGSDIDYDRDEVYTKFNEEKCIDCHRAYGENNISAGDDLPVKIAEEVPSLRYDHELHMELAEEVCVRCHTAERNFNTTNLMTCTSCHYGLTHKTQKYDKHVPDADTCSGCHNGRPHVWGIYAEGLEDDGVFFYNDCPAAKEIGDGVKPLEDNCNRCHPELGGATIEAAN